MQEDFINFNLDHFGYSSVQELIEKLFLGGIIESYQRIDKCAAIENDIRDRFIVDFYKNNSLLKKWIQSKVLHVNWERWVFKNDSDLGRADLSFELSGIDFIVECKRLKFADKKYIDDGLDRFINLEYGEGDNYAGMMGFVVSGDEQAISNKLKEKVILRNHNDSLFEEKINYSWNPSFNSTHNRVDSTPINIFHLFFSFKLENSIFSVIAN